MPLIVQYIKLRLAQRPFLFRSLLLLFYLFFCLLMWRIMMQYTNFKSDEAFLATKQDYVIYTHYQIAFFIHVFTSILALPAGFTQFSFTFRKHRPVWHRRLGWVYIISILFLAGPSGLIIGMYANGGVSSRIAFCLLAILWVVFTLLATQTAIRKQWQQHRKWMIRSFAFTLSAITLRAWKFLLVAWLHPKPMDVYQVVAWLGWVLNWIIAEIYIFNTFIRKNQNP